MRLWRPVSNRAVSSRLRIRSANFYNPETITAYTIGSKNRFFDNHLQLNLEAFWWNYKDQQVSHFIAFAGAPVFATENIGSSRIRGVEAELRYQLGHRTELNATVQYLDARNTNYVYTSAASGGPPISGCVVTGPSSGQYTVNCDGTRPANAPEWTFSAGIEHSIPLGGAGELSIYAGTRYQSKTFTGTELLASQIQSGYFTSDAQVEFTSADGKYSIAGFVNNIENNNVVGFSQAHPRVGASLLIENLRMPRTYGVRAGIKF